VADYVGRYTGITSMLTALESESCGLEASKVIITPLMPLAPGTKRGPYEILSPFGAAGGGQYAAAPERPSR
jgi:hypothetical protein